MNQNQNLGELFRNGLSNLLSSAVGGVKTAFSDNREAEALKFQQKSVEHTGFEWKTLQVLRVVFQVFTGILMYYGAMHVSQEPIEAIAPENGLLVARVLSMFFVVGFEIGVYSITKRATFNWLKAVSVKMNEGLWGYLFKGVIFTAVLFCLCFFSWKAAQKGAENMVAAKTDKKGIIIDKKVGDLEILKSQHKNDKAGIEKMHNESVKSAEKALASYMGDVTKWKDPKSIQGFNASITSAKNERTSALNKIESEYKQEKANIETGADAPLADNEVKQSMYQRNIWAVSIFLELAKCVIIFFLVRGKYTYTPKRQQRQERQERFMQEEVVEKKSPIHISQPAPTPIVLEKVAEMSKAVVDSKDWVGEFAKLTRNRASYASRIRKATKQGEFDSALNSWLKNEPLIEEACEALSRPYERLKQPINAEFTKTSP